VNVLKLHSEPVREEWLDAYAHLNEAYYLVPISNASWALQDHFGIGVDYFERTGGAIYTVESHLRYLREVRAPAVVEIESMIFDVDAKRLRFAHVMSVGGEVRATFECVALHFDTRSNRTAPLPGDVQTALKAARVVELPEWAGRRVTLEKQ
jgi:acyl-CoA thioesterase FadM